jgi:hypothetical protein
MPVTHTLVTNISKIHTEVIEVYLTPTSYGDQSFVCNKMKVVEDE